jgi:hypothetical protein
MFSNPLGAFKSHGERNKGDRNERHRVRGKEVPIPKAGRKCVTGQDRGLRRRENIAPIV